MKIPGLSVAILHDGQITFARGFGYSNLKNKVQVTPQTVFWIGSLTKQFTSALIMRLVEKGRITVDESLAKSWPKAPHEWSKITIYQLLTHTSGIPEYTEVSSILNQMDTPLNRSSMYSTLAKVPLDFQPGTKFEYSNSNYLLLGDVLKYQTGMSYAKLIESEIATPYKLRSLRLIQTPGQNSTVANGYMTSGVGYSKPSSIDPSFPYSAGDLECTPTDILKWVVGLETKFLTAKSLNEMFTVGTTKDGPSTYGFGWVINKYHNHNMVGHDGEINGFTTSLIQFPDDGYAIAIFSNLNGATLDLISLEIARDLLGIKSPKQIADPTPGITQNIIKAMSDAAKDKIDANLINVELAKVIYRIGKAGFSFSKADLNSMKLVEADLGKGTREYLVKRNEIKFEINCTVDATGKLIGAIVKPE